MTIKRVLIVDDNELNVELASFLLTGDGLQIATADDGVSALSQVTAFRPDLVLMDIQLPLIDGLEVTRRLRADPANNGLPSSTPKRQFSPFSAWRLNKINSLAAPL